MSKDQDKEKDSKVDRAQKKITPRSKETGGVDGPDPTRYGDWEKKGITSDF